MKESGTKGPFEVGRKYRALVEIELGPHHFVPGREYVFRAAVFDRFMEYTQYCFKEIPNEELQIWFISDYDQEPLAQWRLFFEPVTDA